MRDIASEYLIPNKIKTLSESGHSARLEFGPLERGFGHTLGNALRRILLSHIPGYAITEVRIDGVRHGYTTIDGVTEDILDILLNLKKVVVKLHDKDGAELQLSVKGPGSVTAGDIQLLADAEIVNPEQHIAHLAAGAKLNMNLTVRRGRGYVSSDARLVAMDADEETMLEADIDANRLRLDALYSPVRRIAYSVEKARKGERADLDKLLIDLETNGVLTPQEAVCRAATILSQHLAPLVDPDAGDGRAPDDEPAALDIDPLYELPIDDLGLSTRTENNLKKEGVHLIGSLVRLSEVDILKMPNIGKSSMDEIKNQLTERSLSLGTVIRNWPMQ